MKIAILGGAGAMGMVIGARLAQAGQAVTLVDVFQPAIDAINTQGLKVDDKQTGESVVVTNVKAITDSSSADVQDLVMVFVKCYHTESAIKQAAPMIGPNTTVMTIQNGWGNGPRIAGIVGEDKVVIGLTYHSATALGPGHALHTGKGISHVGEMSGPVTPRLQAIADVFNAAGLITETTEQVLPEIYMKLALNCCTLPTSALLRFEAHMLVEHDGTLDLMRGILREVVAVANAQGIPLDYLERWNAITALLKKAVGGKASMLQDVEKQRQTEIDVINGAIVAAGRKLGIPTPYNESMVWMVKALEERYLR
jgi:2-dehydropantoate 2-reductase